MRLFLKAGGRFLGLLHVLLVLSLTAHAQAPAWQAVVAAGSNSAHVNAATADAAGNVYLAGYYSGPLTLGTTTLPDGGGNDAFVAKWSNTTRSFVWAVRGGGSSNDDAVAVAVNGSAVYVTGSFSATATFGPANLTSTGSTPDMFVAKLTDAGTTGSFTWAVAAGSSQYEFVKALAVNGSSVYVAGSFSGASVSFGNWTVQNVDPWSTSYDVFVAKLTDQGSTGSFAWAQRAGALGSEEIGGLAAVPDGRVFLAGSFQGATTSIGSTSLNNAGTNSSRDVFVAQLRDNGADARFDWAQRAGGPESETVAAVTATDSSVYVAGYYTGSSASFGSTTLANFGSGILPGSDVFVAKLLTTGAGAGSFRWAQRAGGTDFDQAYAMTAQGADLYLAGTSSSRVINFGGLSAQNNSGQFNDMFLAKLTDQGPTATFGWLQQAGSPGGDLPTAVAVSGTRVFLAGVTSPPTTFGSLTLTQPTGFFGLIPFLATLDDQVLTSTTAAASRPMLAVYPNPAQDLATVQLPALPGHAQATLLLLDALGRPVLRQAVRLPAATVALPLPALVPGLYRLRVQAGPHVLTSPLAVE